MKKEVERSFRTNKPTAPISEHIDNFLRIKSLQVKDVTLRGYYRRLFKIYSFCKTDIITEELFQKFLIFIKKQVSSGQYNLYLLTLKQYIRFLAERSYLPSSAYIKSYRSIPEVILRDKHYYTNEEIDRFLSEILRLKFPRWLYWFIWFGFMFGIRPKELAYLEVRDIDLDKGILLLRAEITKTTTQAKLPLPPKLLPNIQKLLSWRSLQNTSSKRLFVNTRGDPITETSLANHRKKLQSIDGKFRYYDMRYTAGWRAYRHSGDIYLAARLLRHSDINQTKSYLQIQEEESLLQMKEKLDEVY